MKSIRAIILAAGMGSRLGELTRNRPKCMINLHDRPLIYWQLKALKQAGISEIVMVGGYKIDELRELPAEIVENPDYAKTNMVRSLLCAERYFDEEFIMVYSDILYNPEIIQKLIDSPVKPAVVVDREWEPYWRLRFDNILDDAESLKVSEKGHLISIGQKSSNPENIEGQYIGMVYFNETSISSVLSLVEKEKSANRDKKNYICRERDLDKLFITDLLQGLINEGFAIAPEWTRGGWLEIDSEKDLKIATGLTEVKNGRLFINR